MSRNKIITFGKHKGKPLEKVPWQYLKWALSEIKFDKSQIGLKAAMQSELQRKSIF